MSNILRGLLGRNVRAERRRRKLTQEKLAEQLAVTPRYLAAIERGERNLTLDSIERLATQLDLEPLQLLSDPTTLSTEHTLTKLPTQDPVERSYPR